jgi:hypothetical protein
MEVPTPDGVGDSRGGFRCLQRRCGVGALASGPVFGGGGCDTAIRAVKDGFADACSLDLRILPAEGTGRKDVIRGTEGRVFRVSAELEHSGFTFLQRPR